MIDRWETTYPTEIQKYLKTILVFSNFQVKHPLWVQ